MRAGHVLLESGFLDPRGSLEPEWLFSGRRAPTGQLEHAQCHTRRLTAEGPTRPIGCAMALASQGSSLAARLEPEPRGLELWAQVRRLLFKFGRGQPPIHDHERCGLGDSGSEPWASSVRARRCVGVCLCLCLCLCLWPRLAPGVERGEGHGPAVPLNGNLKRRRPANLTTRLRRGCRSTTLRQHSTGMPS
jgi:hypothetical protein